MPGLFLDDAEPHSGMNTVKSVSAKSPAHAKSGPTHFASIYGKELISRPLLYKWNHCLETYFRPSPGDVYWWEEEQLISLQSQKTSFRARIVMRRKDTAMDLVMEWSTKMVLLKPAREDAVRRAMLQLKDMKTVSFDDKENRGSNRGG